MPLPKHVFDPPFNIVRASHVVLGVADLGRSKAFYEGALGLDRRGRGERRALLRGVEERQHHSLVLTRARRRGASHRLQGRQRGGPRQGGAFLQGQGAAARVRRAAVSGAHAAGGRSVRHADASFISRWRSASGCCSTTAATRACRRSASTISMCSRPTCRARPTSTPASASASPSTPRRTAPSGRIAAVMAAPQGQRARHRLHQRPRTPPAPPRLLGADGDEHHPPLRCDGDDGLSRQHGARARPARHRQRLLPLRARSRRPPHRVLHLRLPDHGPRPRAAALVACAIRAGRRCGASRRRGPGSRRAPRLPDASSARRCSKPTSSSRAEGRL